jgi:CP family cyanate transporter-like MFS transporter
MMIGVTLGPTLTIPLVLPLVGGSWRADLLVWSVPGLAAALLYTAFARTPQAAPSSHTQTSRRWWPSWNSPLLWVLGITLGVNNALFYAVNAFVPDYLTATGRSGLIGLTLSWLNGAQLLASFFLLAMAESVQRRSWPFTVFGPLLVLGLIGMLLGDGVWLVISAAVVGFAASVTFVVTFGLPAILAAPDDVHRMAGGMFTISYSIAVVTPILCGAFWDLTGIPWTSFVPIVICGVALTIFGTMLTLRKASS